MTFGRAGAGLVLGVALALDAGTAHGDGIMLIEAGAFWMGSDSDDPNEAPSHRVYVRDVWIDRDKVTNLARFAPRDVSPPLRASRPGPRSPLHRVPLGDVGRSGREMRQ